MPVFAVKVPIESIAHETLESRVHADLPDAVLSNGMTLTQQPDEGYVVALRLPAERPLAAKQEAVRQVELLLQVIALQNDAFRVRMGAVTAAQESEGAIESRTGVSTSGNGIRVALNDVVFVEGACPESRGTWVTILGELYAAAPTDSGVEAVSG